MILREVKNIYINIYIKNRLTEGVDYKRYEWLDSTDGKISPEINETDFQSLTMYRIGNPNTNIMRTTQSYYGNQAMSFSFESWIPGFALYNPGTKYVTIKEPNIEFSLTKDGNNIIYQGTSRITISYPLTKVVWVSVTNNMTRLKSISTSTGQYLPCKLLQDIPASLSINNQAYTADTCGLIYTTTGKFIGNSKLTVEGDVEPETYTGLQQIYQNKLIDGVDYQTYDWLKSTNGAKIGLDYTNNENYVGHLKVDNYCDMYPCQLLRSIPRNLDAQCKERVAGECGMIDLISGKFYGNVANSGTFTVENDNN